MESISYHPLGGFPTYVTVYEDGFSNSSQLRRPPGIAIAPDDLS